MQNEVTLWGLIAAVVALAAKTLVSDIPKMLEHFRKRVERETDARENVVAGERQDDVATFANMVSLQTRMSHQNEKLIDYFIMDFRQDVVDLKNAMSSLESQLAADAKETNQRLQTSSLELNQVSAQQKIIASETVRLTDAMFEFEGKITYALSCIPDLLERDAPN